MNDNDVKRTIALIEKMVAIAINDGATDAERATARKTAEAKIAKLGLTWADFAYVTEPVEPPTRKSRVRKSTRESVRKPTTASSSNSSHATASNNGGTTHAKAGSKGRRDWTASQLKLARQAVWDALESDEIKAHRLVQKNWLDAGVGSQVAAQKAWAESVTNGVSSGSLAGLATECALILAWASHSYDKAA